MEFAEGQSPFARIVSELARRGIVNAPNDSIPIPISDIRFSGVASLRIKSSPSRKLSVEDFQKQELGCLSDIRWPWLRLLCALGGHTLTALFSLVSR